MRPTEPAGSQLVLNRDMRTETPAAWQRELVEWSITMQASRLTAQTIELRTSHIRRVARSGLAASPWEIEGEDLVTWVGSHVWKRETARAMRSSLRRFWAWGTESGRTERNPALALPEVRPETPSPRPAAPEAVVSALTACAPRVALMVRLANELGMRRGEVAQVHPTNDLVRDPQGWSLIVHGKGARKRMLPLPEELAAQLLAAGDDYLFPSPRGGHLTAHWVGSLVSRALGDGATMHQLRHLCATEIHDATRDVRLVQVVLGHASLATTQRYLAVDHRQIRAAVADRSARWSERR